MTNQIEKGTPVEVHKVFCYRPPPEDLWREWFSGYVFSHYEKDTAIVIYNDPTSLAYECELRYDVIDIRVASK